MSGINLETLKEYFIDGNAEEEIEFLPEVFVKNGGFDAIVTPKSRSISLLVGSKGSGKSALLGYWYAQCQKYEFPAIKLVPTDLEIESLKDLESLSITRKIYRALVYEIAVKVGTELNGNGFLTEEQESLLNKAIEAGARDATPIDRILQFLLPVGKALTQIEFDAMLPNSVMSTRADVNAINHNLPNGKFFYLLFDNIDEFGDAGSENYINAIWCAISAFVRLAERLPNVRVIVTLRREIWRQILNRGVNERDKVDTVRSMVKDLSPTGADVGKILDKRLEYCSKQDGVKDFIGGGISTIFSPFFEGDVCNPPNSSKPRSWRTYLVTSSRNRPRDTVQLVRRLVDNAKENNDPKICDRNVQDTALSYSEERFNDLVTENKDLCLDLEIVIRSFADLKESELDASTVREHLLNIPGIGPIRLTGTAARRFFKQDHAVTLCAQNLTHAFALWDILYLAGFLNPRARDNTQSEGYRHIDYFSDSTLIQRGRWDEIEQYKWEIHPCYRPYLTNIKQEKAKRVLSAQDGDEMPSNPNGRNPSKGKKRGKGKRGRTTH